MPHNAGLLNKQPRVKLAHRFDLASVIALDDKPIVCACGQAKGGESKQMFGAVLRVDARLGVSASKPPPSATRKASRAKLASQDVAGFIVWCDCGVATRSREMHRGIATPYHNPPSSALPPRTPSRFDSLSRAQAMLSRIASTAEVCRTTAAALEARRSRAICESRVPAGVVPLPPPGVAVWQRAHAHRAFPPSCPATGDNDPQPVCPPVRQFASLQDGAWVPGHSAATPATCCR